MLVRPCGRYLFCASRCSGAGDELDRPSLEAFLTRDLRLNMSPAETERAWQAMGGDTHVGFGAFKHWFSTDPVDMHVLTLGSGSYFGELSLLYDEPRAATVIASEAGLLWSIDIRDFQHVVVHGNEIKAAMVKDTISKVRLLPPPPCQPPPRCRARCIAISACCCC
jgi:CRP-like cAMP-binding protein